MGQVCFRPISDICAENYIVIEDIADCMTNYDTYSPTFVTNQPFAFQSKLFMTKTSDKLSIADTQQTTAGL